ncbi:uncharacterized protein B0T23DRAFT_127544 [Neurospora hispaniola]|uniref:Subtelomeric hrmA-associated cluster protein AFUB-079030/YDR124W-like helical bundle domain-containing protein n=1 Tax=Neurospora hispaniola TaxID=588809 RepID=A0AAJ0MT84_9PEZI|nr:hypothetical protein B0T23DRAFT_127544 [Neurospora hispaniola]
MVNTYGHGHYTRPQWTTERPNGEHMPDNGRYYDTGIRTPPPTISEVLREQCKINHQSFFLAVLTEDGHTVYFTGPNKLPEGEIQRYFDMDRFIRYQKRAAENGLVGAYDEMSFGPEYHGRRGCDRRMETAEQFYDHVPPTYRTRKRQRANVPRRVRDDDEPAVTVSAKKGIRINNAQEVWDFYDQRFKKIQQNTCKLIAKAWIKAIAPKKQSTHPYTGTKIPDWWPKPLGPTKDEGMRHKEPDHLFKPERLRLLCHLLRLIVEPNSQQHPSIRAQELTVAKLEELTMEAMGGFFSDRANPNQAKKKPFLKEIFKVAKVEEQYKRGEIDGDTVVYVMADNNQSDFPSDDEDDACREEDDEHHLSVISSRLSPPKTTMPHALMPIPTTDHSPTTNIQPGFVSEMSIRNQYPTTLMPPDLTSDQHYVENGGIPVGGQASLQQHGAPVQMQEMIPSPHETSRRPSLFSSPSDYASTSASGLYPGAWQQTTTAPGSAPIYSFGTSSQQPQQPPHPPLPHPQGTFVSHQGVQIGQNQPPYMGSSFDTLPHTNNGLFRGPNVSQGSVSHGQNYPSYMHHDSRGLPGDMKMDPSNRGLPPH